MQGELYLEEPCQVKFFFQNPSSHKSYIILLNLRRSVTTQINANSYSVYFPILIQFCNL